MKRVVLGLVLVALVVAAALFEPWRIFTDSTVDEAAPTQCDDVGRRDRERPGRGRRADRPHRPRTLRSPQDRVLAEGDFEDAEHGTDGVARILELADGRRFVRLEGLATSDGPDLHVWITDQPSGGEWGSYDDGRYVRLGELKANNGNQNYEIPAKADLGGLASVVIWCDRFNVAFGTAPVDL